MEVLPRHTLTHIIAKYGRDICGSPKRVEALLRDLCGTHIREINILIGALEERVAADLMRTGKSVPRKVLLTQLGRRLQDHLAYTPEAARWAVDSWAVALGVLSKKELEAREPEASSANDSSVYRSPLRRATAASRSSINSSPPNVPTLTASPTVQPQSKSPTNPLNAPRPKYPAMRPQPSPPGVYTPQPSLFGWKLRGCLFSVVLLAVLIVSAFFVVPAILTILREEQSQPSINDPRIP